MSAVTPAEGAEDGLARARAELEAAEAAFVEAERQVQTWMGVVAEAEKALAKAKAAYETAAVAVWQPVQNASDARIRAELDGHQRLRDGYAAFAWNLRRDPNAMAPI